MRIIKRYFRVLLVNNGLGMTFKLSNNRGYALGSVANEFVAAEGHNVPRFPLEEISPLRGVSPARAWAESFGFRYLSARTKGEFEAAVGEFVSTSSDRPVLFECFTRDPDERAARGFLVGIDGRRTASSEMKRVAKGVLPTGVIGGMRKLLGS